MEFLGNLCSRYIYDAVYDIKDKIIPTLIPQTFFDRCGTISFTGNVICWKPVVGEPMGKTIKK